MGSIEEAQQSTIASTSTPGDWLTGAQRVAVWREVRDAAVNELDQERKRALSPNAVEGAHAASAELPASAMEVVHRVAFPTRDGSTRTWADGHIADLGEETYTELIGVTAIVQTIDRFHAAMGLDEWELGTPTRR